MTTTHTVPGLAASSMVQRFARQTAGEARRRARRANVHEQRLAVTALLHDNPALLVEVVLHLARTAPDYTAAEAAQVLDSEGG